MKIRMINKTKTMRGVVDAGDYIELPVVEAIQLIESGDAEAEDLPFCENEPFKHMTGEMKGALNR